MVHPQPPTPVVTDIAKGYGFSNENIIQRRSRAIYIYFYWVCYRVNQVHYLAYFKIGKYNITNYFTRHHPTKHHHAIIITYPVPTVDSRKQYYYKVPTDLQGRVQSLPAQKLDNRLTRSPPTTNGKVRKGMENPLDIRRCIHRLIKPY